MSFLKTSFEVGQCFIKVSMPFISLKKYSNSPAFLKIFLYNLKIVNEIHKNYSDLPQKPGEGRCLRVSCKRILSLCHSINHSNIHFPCISLRNFPRIQTHSVRLQAKKQSICQGMSN